MKRVFLDLETLGRGHDALILSCGVAVSNSNGPKLNLMSTELFPSIGQQLAKGRKIEYETVKWWATESPPAYPFKHPEEKRLHLNNLCSEILSRTNGVDEIWSNSPSFDLAILRHLFHSIGFSEPWPFYKERDFRTLKSIFRKEYEGFKLNYAVGGQGYAPHSALFDVDFMAHFAMGVL